MESPSGVSTLLPGEQSPGHLLRGDETYSHIPKAITGRVIAMSEVCSAITPGLRAIRKYRNPGKEPEIPFERLRSAGSMKSPAPAPVFQFSRISMLKSNTQKT